MRYQDKGFEVSFNRDIRYGEGGIHHGTTSSTLPLMLDFYEPRDEPSQSPRPALILAFGGAFHRGSKETDGFEVEGRCNTSIAAYCHTFARRGYATFSIDSRLVQEDPDPGTTPTILDAAAIPRSRVDAVRQLLGLPPATAGMLHAGIEAACDDMAAAFGFVSAQADRFRIDRSRIAIGGFSAGARTALGAAYGERIPAAAVVSLSGFIVSGDMTRWITPGATLPPALLVTGEHDLDYIVGQAPAMRDHFARLGLAHESWTAPGQTHFYRSDCKVVQGDGSSNGLENVIAMFLFRALGL